MATNNTKPSSNMMRIMIIKILEARVNDEDFQKDERFINLLFYTWLFIIIIDKVLVVANGMGNTQLLIIALGNIAFWFIFRIMFLNQGNRAASFVMIISGIYGFIQLFGLISQSGFHQLGLLLPIQMIVTSCAYLSIGIALNFASKTKSYREKIMEIKEYAKAHEFDEIDEEASVKYVRKLKQELKQKHK